VKRWASRLRLRKRICLFLLLGAIVNIAVAWGCAIRMSYFVAYGKQHPFSSCTPVTPAERVWLHQYQSDLSQHEIEFTRWTAFGWYAECALVFAVDVPRDPQTDPLIYQRTRCGWPFSCLRSQTASPDVATESEAKSLQQQATKPRLHDDRYAHLIRIDRNVFGIRIGLPSWPLVPGFAINTLFYAAMLWLLFAAPFALRRRTRIKRGLCPACAYPVGASDVCTECGRPVHRAASAT
jgi:hypothetical protein